MRKYLFHEIAISIYYTQLPPYDAWKLARLESIYTGNLNEPQYKKHYLCGCIRKDKHKIMYAFYDCLSCAGHGSFPIAYEELI